MGKIKFFGRHVKNTGNLKRAMDGKKLEVLLYGKMRTQRRAWNITGRMASQTVMTIRVVMQLLNRMCCLGNTGTGDFAKHP